MPGLEWVQQKSTLVSAVTSAKMVMIWEFCLQVFLVSYLRQKRVRVHIDRGAATDETARCTATNMGQETIYLSVVVVELIFDAGRE